MLKPHPKLVHDNHYHLWTDALHARALAHQAGDKWNRGTYVRWAVITSWIVLEIACQDALEDPAISRSFRRNLDKAISAKALPPLDWSSGIWQEVTFIQDARKNCVHRFMHENDRFPETALADKAIRVIRGAVKAIYSHVGHDLPAWIEDDDDPGWPREQRDLANATMVAAPGLDGNPCAVKVAFVLKGREHEHAILPPGTDPSPHIDTLIRSVNSPISAVRIYRGDQLIYEIDLPMRGA